MLGSKKHLNKNQLAISNYWLAKIVGQATNNGEFKIIQKPPTMARE